MQWERIYWWERRKKWNLIGRRVSLPMTFDYWAVRCEIVVCCLHHRALVTVWERMTKIDRIFSRCCLVLFFGSIFSSSLHLFHSNWPQLSAHFRSSKLRKCRNRFDSHLSHGLLRWNFYLGGIWKTTNNFQWTEKLITWFHCSCRAVMKFLPFSLPKGRKREIENFQFKLYKRRSI